MENSKNDHSLGKKLLHGFQFLLNNTWLFYILIALALFIAIALRMHQAGISLFPKQTNISVKSPYYQAGMTYWEELDYVSAEEQLLLALKETQETNGTSSLETAEVMQKLGALYLEMDKIDECYDYLNSAYVTFLEKLGPSDGMTTIAKCQICLYDIATDNVERGLAGLTDAYDATKDMSQKMQIAQLLAQSHTSLGNYSEAGQYYKILLRFSSESGASGLYQSIIWNDYGVMLLDQGETKEAITAFEQAVSLWSRSSTTAEQELAKTYENTALAYSYLHQTEQAIDYINKALNIRKSLGDNESINVANTYLTASTIYDDLGMDAECLSSLESALQVALSARGENHLVTGTIYRSLGTFYSLRHEMSLAIEYHLKALEIQKNILGEKSNITSVAYQRLCDDFNEVGDYTKSIEYGQKAIEICESLHKKDNPLTAAAYLQIAWPYMNSGDYDSALFYAELGTDICDRHLDKEDYTLAWAHQTLGQAYSKAERYPEAFSNLQMALNLYQNLPTVDYSKELATTYHFLGSAYLSTSEYSSALSAYQSELAIINQLPESDKPAFNTIYNSLGFTLYQLQEYDEALKYYEEAEQFYQAIIDASSQEDSIDSYRNLASVYNNIAAVYENLETYDLAAQYELQAYRILKNISIDYTEEPRIAQRLERLYQQINPHISFEEWLESGGR